MVKDINKFWEDMQLLRELRNVIDNISPKDDVNTLLKRSADTIERLRNELIDPAEYIRVSNERGALLTRVRELEGK
jgi:hypothetical protein